MSFTFIITVDNCYNEDRNIPLNNFHGFFFISLHYFIYIVRIETMHIMQQQRLAISFLLLSSVPISGSDSTTPPPNLKAEQQFPLFVSYTDRWITGWFGIILHWVQFFFVLQLFCSSYMMALLPSHFCYVHARWYNCSSSAHILQLLQTSRIFHYASFQCQVAHFSLFQIFGYKSWELTGKNGIMLAALCLRLYIRH